VRILWLHRALQPRHAEQPRRAWQLSTSSEPATRECAVADFRLHPTSSWGPPRPDGRHIRGSGALLLSLEEHRLERPCSAARPSR
jgi:hypothetical protein